MRLSPAANPTFRRDLGDGLILRWSTADDVERVAAVTAEVFGSVERPNEADRKCVIEMMRPDYPFGGPGDWAVVEDTKAGQFVAASSLMSQTWTYDGIPFAVGRPEHVTARPEHRGRGLIRAIFELLHARSAARGQLVQVIDGIPYFYRQFGYEYALDIYGGRRVYWAAIDKRAVSEADEAYGLRAATLEDVPLMTRLYELEQADSLVSVAVDGAHWRWVLTEQDHTTDNGWRPLVIVEAATSEAVGYVVLRDGYQWSDENALAVTGVMTQTGTSLRRVMPSVLRGLKRMLPTFSKRMAGDPSHRILFVLGREHPVYQALDQDLIVPARRPYAWYVRVPDLVAFVRRIAPAIERRLEGSAFAGLSDTLSISFFRGMLTLRFKNGALAAVDETFDRRGMSAGETGGAPVGMPRDQFLQLLFGYWSMDELRHSYPDILSTDDAFRLLETLFPKRLSRPLLVN